MTKGSRSTTALVLTAAAAAITLLTLVYFVFFGTSAAVRTYRHGLAVLDPKKDKEKLGELQWAATQADPQFEWKTPIAFYGKIVDEEGKPVQGANIKCIWTDLSREGTSTAALTSDSHGRFSLTGVRGKNLGIEIKTEGYHTRRKQNQFDFEYANIYASSFHRADPNQPVVFHLLKKNVAEPLLHRSVFIKLSHDGSPVYLDLLRWKIGEQQWL